MIALMLTLAELRSIKIGLSMVPHSELHDRVERLVDVETRLGSVEETATPCYTIINRQGVAFSTYRDTLADRLEAAVDAVLRGADQDKAMVYRTRPRKRRAVQTTSETA